MTAGNETVAWASISKGGMEAFRLGQAMFTWGLDGSLGMRRRYFSLAKPADAADKGTKKYRNTRSDQEEF
jgi:hypothetical protein